MERAELSPLSASGSVLVADINVSLLWPQVVLGKNYLTSGDIFSLKVTTAF